MGTHTRQYEVGSVYFLRYDTYCTRNTSQSSQSFTRPTVAALNRARGTRMRHSDSGGVLPGESLKEFALVFSRFFLACGARVTH